MASVTARHPHKKGHCEKQKEVSDPDSKEVPSDEIGNPLVDEETGNCAKATEQARQESLSGIIQLSPAAAVRPSPLLRREGKRAARPISLPQALCEAPGSGRCWRYKRNHLP